MDRQVYPMHLSGLPHLPWRPPPPCKLTLSRNHCKSPWINYQFLVGLEARKTSTTTVCSRNAHACLQDQSFRFLPASWMPMTAKESCNSFNRYIGKSVQNCCRSSLRNERSVSSPFTIHVLSIRVPLSITPWWIA